MKGNAKLERRVATISMTAMVRHLREDAGQAVFLSPASSAVVAIDSMDRSACIVAWHKQFHREPPGYISIRLMRRVLAFETQVKMYGGHSVQIRRHLSAALRQTAGPRPKANGKTASTLSFCPLVLSPGTQLVREWNGRSYVVEVLDKGFRMDGKVYKSLTAIAKKITGAGWSGPRFFGLNR